MLLASLGGLIGVGLGVGLGSLKSATMQPIVSPASVVLSFCVSVLIGIFFGAYPASRAARPDPDGSPPLRIAPFFIRSRRPHGNDESETQKANAGARSFDLDAMGLGPPTKVRRRGKIDKWTRILGVAVVLLLVFNLGVRLGHSSRPKAAAPAGGRGPGRSPARGPGPGRARPVVRARPSRRSRAR